MSRLLIGLTGGIGSGKSAAAERFAEHDVAVVDADLASRAVVEPGQPALQQIAAHFSSDVLQPDGTLDRARLRQIVFADPEQRVWLQGLLHPLISSHLRGQIEQATAAYVLLVNPLLIESRQNAWCDRVLVVDVPENVQLQRTMQRDGNSAEQVKNIMRAQASRQQRLQQADDVIVNDGSLQQLRDRVDQLHQTYLSLCPKHLV